MKKHIQSCCRRDKSRESYRGENQEKKSTTFKRSDRILHQP